MRSGTAAQSVESVCCCWSFEGFFPVWLCERTVGLQSPWFAAVMAAPVLGHAYSVYHRGRGGKAIAVSFGVLLGLVPAGIWQPLAMLVLFYLLFSLLPKIKSHARRSVVTYLCFAAGTCLTVKERPVLMGSLLIAGTVIYRHIGCLGRKKMNVLILSCNTGGGHNAAARAVAEVFRAHGDEAVVLDYLKLAGEKVSRTVGNVYVETVKIAPVCSDFCIRSACLSAGFSAGRRSIMSTEDGSLPGGLSEETSGGRDCHAASVSGGNHYLYEAKGNEASAHGGGDDGLYLYPVLGRDGLRLLYDSARESDPEIVKRGIRKKSWW